MVDDSETSAVKPFSTFNIEKLDFPVLVSIPHAGRDYPAEIMQNLAVSALKILRLEDRYADRLAEAVISSGFPTIVARRPRAWIDLNRSVEEIDPDMVTGISSKQVSNRSRKVRGGLGLIPRRLAGVGDLWREKWNWQDIEQRIRADHEPYHEYIGSTLEKMRVKFGTAILLDLHSMPPLDGGLNGDAQIVIGDSFGRSASSRYSEIALTYFERSGFRVKLNHPYAGGYILDRHGRADNDIHAIQLEIDRTCYLDSELREPGAGLPKVAACVKALADQLANQIDDQFLLAAAE